MTTAQGFDLSLLDSSDVNEVTYKVSVIDTDDGDPVSGFILVGKNSKEYQAEDNAIRIENIKRSAKRKTQIDASTDDGAATLVNLIRANEKRLCLAAIVGWFGFNKDGEEAAFDKSVVDRMLTAYPQWQDKVSATLEKDKNFMKV